MVVVVVDVGVVVAVVVDGVLVVLARVLGLIPGVDSIGRLLVIVAVCWITMSGAGRGRFHYY